MYVSLSLDSCGLEVLGLRKFMVDALCSSLVAARRAAGLGGSWAISR